MRPALPLALGETVTIAFAREQWFESSPSYLAIWSPGGPTDLRAFVHDGPPGALDELIAPHAPAATGRAGRPPGWTLRRTEGAAKPRPRDGREGAEVRA